MCVAYHFDYSTLLSFKIKHVSPSVVKLGSCYLPTLCLFTASFDPCELLELLVHQCFRLDGCLAQTVLCSGNFCSARKQGTSAAF